MTPAFAAAADREMRACRDACRELQRMMDMLNADRVGSMRALNLPDGDRPQGQPSRRSFSYCPNITMADRTVSTEQSYAQL